MILSLDFDDTYTVDPNLWNKFVMDALERDHDVYVVTFRHPHQIGPEFDTLIDIVGRDRIIPTSFRQKKAYTQSIGIHIDVWIDDRPDLIIERTPPLVRMIEWGDHQKPNETCRYDHVVGKSGPVHFRIEWKSWKEFDDYVVYVGVGNLGEDFVCSSASLEGAQEDAFKYLVLFMEALSA